PDPPPLRAFRLVRMARGDDVLVRRPGAGRRRPHLVQGDLGRMKPLEAYRGRKVAVLGLARSGAAAAKLFHGLGAEVTANDLKPRGQCPEADELEAMGVTVICGGHPDDFPAADADLLVKNPGIPYSAPPVARAAALGIEIVTEVEVAGQLARAPIIGITGSNGKTTTTTLTGLLLEA